MLIFGLLLFAVGAWTGISAVKAELGEGTHGSFIAVNLDCGRSCSWHGDFESDGAIVASDVTYTGGVNGIYPGTAIPAIYESGVGNACPLHSSAWIGGAALCGLGIFLLVGSGVLINRARRAAPAY